MKYIKTIIALLTLAGIFIIAWQFVSSSKIITPKLYTITVTEDKIITLVAVGDIMLSRNVEQKMIKYNDWLYPFRETYQVTTTGDIVFANLESPIIAGQLLKPAKWFFELIRNQLRG